MLRMLGTLPDCLLSACCSRWPHQMSHAAPAWPAVNATQQSNTARARIMSPSARQAALDENTFFKTKSGCQAMRRTGVCSKVSAAAAWIRRRWPRPPSTKRTGCALQMKMKLHKCEHHVASRTKHSNSLYDSSALRCHRRPTPSTAPTHSVRDLPALAPW